MRDKTPSKLETNTILSEAVRSGFNVACANVPIIGPILQELCYGLSERVRQKRLNNFTLGLIELIKESGLKESDIDTLYLNSDDFVLIFKSITDRAILTTSEDKIRRFQKILLIEIKGEYKSQFKETFLDILSKIDENQILILKTYENVAAGNISYEESIKERGSFDGGTLDTDNKPELLAPFRYSKYYKLKDEQYLFYIQDLVSKSLLQDDGMNRMDIRPYELLKITPFGIEFIRYIEGYDFK